jgi:hypothetical protein
MDDVDKREAYLSKLDAQLREWDGMWEVLKARLMKKRADMRLEGIEILESVERTHAETRQKLADLRRAAAENWTTFKARAEQDLDFLGKAMAVVRSKIGSPASEQTESKPRQERDECPAVRDAEAGARVTGGFRPVVVGVPPSLGPSLVANFARRF